MEQVQTQSPEILIIGTVGIDTIATPVAKRENILGGSASYAGVSASYFAPTALISVIGGDFPEEFMNLYRRFQLDLRGLQMDQNGKTFRWSGIYEKNMNKRRTLETDLNVLETFAPHLPETHCETPYVFLGNISPGLQLSVMHQLKQPRFVMLDTMDLWINIARDELLQAIGQVDLLTLNESEARLLTEKSALMQAAQTLLDMGPRYVLIKKGENGSLLFSSEGKFLMPAYPLDTVADPTGAGDTFAGAFIGALARKKTTEPVALREAMLYGSVVAAFGVEAFSLDNLAELDLQKIEDRAQELKQMMSLN